MDSEVFRTVSAIVPVYNGSDTLTRCLESLQRQGPVLKEIIVIDDGSLDASLDILRSFAEKDPRFIAVQHEQNQGLARTLNDGIARATGDAVLLIQQDCELAADDWIDRALVFLLVNPRTVVAGTPVYPFQEMNSVEVAFGLLRDTFFVAPAEVERLAFSEFKCDLLPAQTLRANRFDTKFRISGEDQVLSTELSRLGFSILRFRELGYVQRFGKGVSFSHQLRKELTYAKTEAGILLRTSFRIAPLSLESSTSRRRLLNRASSFLSATGLMSCLLLLAAGVNLFVLVVPLLLVVARIGTVAARWFALRRTARLAVRSLVWTMAVAPLTDVVYLIGLLAGFVRYVTADAV